MPGLVMSRRAACVYSLSQSIFLYGILYAPVRCGFWNFDDTGCDFYQWRLVDNTPFLHH